MNYFDVKATEENLANCLEYDCLGRKSELINLIRILDFPKQGFTIAIDGGWGSGKTFFVKQAISILNYSNYVLNLERSSDAERIMAAWEGVTKSEKENMPQKLHYAAYYDAWEHDDSEDPVLSILYQLTKATGTKVLSEPKLKEIGLKIADLIIGNNVSDFVSLIQGDNILENEEKSHAIRMLVKEYINELSMEQAQRFDLFIDELDRCSPTYAIRLLERVKHFFDCDNLTIIFSINATELKKTVAKFYGNGLDGISYLDKFFDMRMGLNKPQDLEDFFRLNGLDIRSLKSLSHDRICYIAAKHMNLELREIVHYIKIVRLVNSRFIRSGDEYSGLKMLHMLLAPILIALKMKSPDEYERCIRGEDPHHILEILAEHNERYYCNLMKEKDEMFEWESASDKKMITRDNKLTELYNMIFPVEKIQQSWMQMGDIVIYKSHVEDLIKSCNLLAGALSFETINDGE